MNRRNKHQQTLDHYTYSVSWSAKDDIFVARVAEFPLLAAHGESQEKALKEIKVAVEGVIEDMIDSREEIPKPLGERSYSGKLNVRMPESLHRRLAAEAAEQRVSLNHLITLKLAFENE
jgi:predicted RNase H-like HicB family nuclease